MANLSIAVMSVAWNLNSRRGIRWSRRTRQLHFPNRTNVPRKPCHLWPRTSYGELATLNAMIVSRKLKMPVMRCPYCAEDNNFKVMIRQGGPEDWYMCARCGHLNLPTNPLFQCT